VRGPSESHGVVQNCCGEVKEEIARGGNLGEYLHSPVVLLNGRGRGPPLNPLFRVCTHSPHLVQFAGELGVLQLQAGRGGAQRRHVRGHLLETQRETHTTHEQDTQRKPTVRR
jgi:hypothetical protein